MLDVDDSQMVPEIILYFYQNSSNEQLGGYTHALSQH